MAGTMRMSYQEYIVSKARLARLEAHDQPYFASMNDTDLQKAMNLRRIPLVGTRSQMIYELEQHYRTMYSEYIKRLLRQERRMHRDRLEFMLTSSFERDPSRSSFMDLSGEIRNSIYGFALSEGPTNGFHRHHWDEYWAFEVHDNGIRPGPLVHPGYTGLKLRCRRTLSTLKVLGGLNKEVWKEATTFFWSRIMITLEPCVKEPYCLVVCRFLEKIGPHARSAVANLEVPPIYAKHRNQHADFQAMLTILEDCKNLKSLQLYLPLHIIMGPPDREALKDFFSRGQPLRSSGVDRMVEVLHSMKKLRQVRLHTELYEIGRYELYSLFSFDKFSKFAFTGVRAIRLAQEIHTRLMAGKTNVHVEVTGAQDRLETYEEWLLWEGAEID
jgi:hypothetical protein